MQSAGGSLQAQEAVLHAQPGEASPVVVAERGGKASTKGQRQRPAARVPMGAGSSFFGKGAHIRMACPKRMRTPTRFSHAKRMFFLIFVLGLIPKSVFFIFFIVSGWDKTEKGNRGEGVVPEGVVPEGVVPETTNRQTEI